MTTTAIKTPKVAINAPELERTWKIKSDTSDTVYYLRFVNSRWVCSCPDTRYNKNPECKHVRRVLAEIAAMREEKLQKEATQVAEEATVKARLAEMEQQFTELRSQVAQLAQAQPLHITAQSIVIDAPVKARRSPAKDEAPAAIEEHKITEIMRNGQLVACEIDGMIHNGMTIACTCERGSDGKQCKHDEAVNAYLKTREAQPKAPEPKPYDPKALPLNGNRPFSLLRK